MLKLLMVTTAIGGLAIGAAQAQSTPPASTSMPATTTTAASGEKFIASQSPDQFLASKFKGTDVLGTDDKKIGDVSDILFDKEGKVHAFIVGVGGFLGVGAKDVAMAPSAFTVVKGQNGASDKLKVAMTQDQLKQAANFEPYNPRPVTTGAGTSGSMAPRPATAPAPAK